jgi:hypothetical protein
MNWKKITTDIFAAGLVIFLSVFSFDLLAYFLVPQDWVGFVPYYRAEFQPQNLPTHARGYPRGYFRADGQLGFDIQENVRNAVHVFPEASIPIFSNDVGCFDRNRLEDFKRSGSFDYFAGDSQTWGYAIYERKFPTVYERKTGRLSAKCGVTHTGQLHQYDKFQKTVSLIGRYPARVFVGYVGNDPSNDFAHPHTTVIEGFQVDTVEVDGTTLVDRDLEPIRERILEWLATSPEPVTPIESLQDHLKKWSLSANLIYVGKERLVSTCHGGPLPIYSLDTLYDFKQDYASNDITARNRQAIREWSKDAKDHSYELTFLLFPPKHRFSDTSHFSGLREFLKSHQVGFVDFTFAFQDSDRGADSLYWPVDRHFNNEGNEFVGEYLSKQ